MANAKVEDNNSQEASHPEGKIVLHWQPHPTFTIPAHVRLLKISPFEGGAGGGGFSRECKCCQVSRRNIKIILLECNKYAFENF